MEYSIQELSKLSGVTTRTLRWYDQIGLLPEKADRSKRWNIQSRSYQSCPE